MKVKEFSHFSFKNEQRIVLKCSPEDFSLLFRVFQARQVIDNWVVNKKLPVTFILLPEADDYEFFRLRSS